jgi:hypothetical protein
MLAEWDERKAWRSDCLSTLRYPHVIPALAGRLRHVFKRIGTIRLIRVGVENHPIDPCGRGEFREISPRPSRNSGSMYCKLSAL